MDCLRTGDYRQQPNAIQGQHQINVEFPEVTCRWSDSNLGNSTEWFVKNAPKLCSSRNVTISGEFRKVLIFLAGPVNGRLFLIHESRRFPRTQNLIFVISLKRKGGILDHTFSPTIDPILSVRRVLRKIGAVSNTLHQNRVFQNHFWKRIRRQKCIIFV